MEQGVHVEFLLHPVVNGMKSKEAGREVCDDKPHVRIRVAGNDKDEFFGPVNEQIRARFSEEWDAFQKGMETPKSGTPIERWPEATPGMVRNFKALNIHTVEDLAALPDFGMQKLGMGAQEWRRKAQRFLSLAQTAADVGQLDELREANAKLSDQVAEMQAQIAQLLEARTPEVPEAPFVRVEEIAQPVIPHLKIEGNDEEAPKRRRKQAT